MFVCCLCVLLRQATEEHFFFRIITNAQHKECCLLAGSRESAAGCCHVATPDRLSTNKHCGSFVFLATNDHPARLNDRTNTLRLYRGNRRRSLAQLGRLRDSKPRMFRYHHRRRTSKAKQRRGIRTTMVGMAMLATLPPYARPSYVPVLLNAVARSISGAQSV